MCLSIINLNNFFAIGAAVVLPFPPCSTIIFNAYLGLLYDHKLHKEHDLFVRKVFQMFTSNSLSCSVLLTCAVPVFPAN